MNPAAAHEFTLEIKRKLLHFLALIIPFGLYFFPLKTALFLLFLVTLSALLVETVRRYSGPVQRLFMRFFSPFLRKHEERRLTGSTALLLSASICSLIFLSLEGRFFLSVRARSSLFYAFSFLIVGDAVAAVFGKRYGKQKLFGEKTLVGSAACLMMCLLFFFITLPLIDGGAPAGPVILTACLTTILEALPLKFDDNLSVPPITALCLYTMLKMEQF